MPVARSKVCSSALKDPEVRLMLRVQEDDRDAFRQLLERYRDRVFQQVYLMVGNREEAEDLTQEVFLRVYRHRKSYRAQAKFTTWLFHIARNAARNSLRDRRRRPAFPMLSTHPDPDGNRLDQVLCDRRTESPSDPLERRETRQLVRTALNRLLGRQRTALELQQFQDSSYDDIALRLSLTPQAAKSLLYRARSQLRLALAPHIQCD
jgi:RNA polymerase sigma-70 factor (ECF subfamily)